MPRHTTLAVASALAAALGAAAIHAGPAAAAGQNTAAVYGAAAAHRAAAGNRPAPPRGGVTSPDLAIYSAVPGQAAPRVNFHAWTTYGDFQMGAGRGVSVLPGDRRGIVISRTNGITTYKDPFTNVTKTWAFSTWTSPVYNLDFGATELVSSWDAQTPQGTWLQTQMRATMQDGRKTPWLDMGNYAYGDADIDRTSVSPVAAPYGEVDTDTFFTYTGFAVHAYQLRLTLYRLPGTSVSPRVWQIGAFASAIPPRTTVPPSPLGPASRRGVDLNVPQYSQNIHAGQYVEYGGGGEAWCSPTSNQMVDSYWGHQPSKQNMAWVDPSYTDPQVDYAARYTYDWLYQGTGNWPFNAAYAAHYGLDAEIVQLRNTSDLEQLVARRIPVVISIAFDNGEIPGANYSTDGHLMVVRGFTKNGDVITNDPASNSDPEVLNVYPRRAFEIAWLRTYWTRPDGSTGYGSGGVAYIIKPHTMPLPKVLDPANPSW